MKWPSEPRAELRQVHFWDEASGDSYLSHASEIYHPSALQLPDDLIAVCDAVKADLDHRTESAGAVERTLLSGYDLP
jgi:hypothetical protein